MRAMKFFGKISSIIYQHSNKIKLENRFPFLCNPSRNLKERANNLRPYYEQYVEKVSTPEMACSLRIAVFIQMFCDGLKSKRILGLGSGFSSFVFRSYAASKNEVVVYSIDDNPEWLDHTRDYLALHNLSTERMILWDKFKKYHLNEPFDFIFHDLGNMDLRKSSLDLVLKLGLGGGIILLDDIHKTSYVKYVQDRLSCYSFRYFDLQAYTLDEFGRYSGLLSDVRISSKIKWQ